MFFDHVRRFLANHERHRVGMTGRYDRHDGRVHHSKPFDAPNPEFRVYYRFRIRFRSHLARARLMVQIGGHQSRGTPPVRVRHERFVLATRKRYRQQSGSVFLERLRLTHRNRLKR